MNPLDLPKDPECVQLGESFLHSDGYYYIKIGEDKYALDWEKYVEDGVN